MDLNFIARTLHILVSCQFQAVGAKLSILNTQRYRLRLHPRSFKTAPWMIMAKKPTYPLPESVGDVEVVKGNIGTVNTNSPTCIIGTRGGSRNIIGDRHRCDLPDLAGKGLEDGSEIVSFATHCFRYTSWECLFVRRS